MSMHTDNAGESMIYQSDWQIALNLRGCPPDRVLFGDKNEILKRHLRACYMCRQNQDAQVQQAWTWPDFSIDEQESPEVAPGQVRRISKKLSGWGPKDRYYNPPEVLLLEVIDEQAVSVAQIYPGDEFMTQDDVYIQGHGFAQPWNVYTLSKNDLDQCIETVSSRLVDQVTRHSGSYFGTEEGSFLFLFRCLETEVGSFFSQQSLAVLLNAVHDQDEHIDAAQILEMLQQSGYHLELDPSRDVMLQLAKTDFSGLKQAQHLNAGRPEPVKKVEILKVPRKMAAAGEDNLKVNLFVMDEKGMQVHSGLVTILNKHRQNNCLDISGKIDPDFPPPLDCLAWWEAPLKTVVAPSINFSRDHVFFDIHFDGISREDFVRGRLVLLFFKHKGT